MAALLAVSLSLLASTAAARDVPSNVRSFYDSIRAQPTCNNVLARGFTSVWDDTTASATYCGDHISDYNVVFLRENNGNLVDMDVDCDGLQGGPGDDGRCESSDDTQSITAFQWILEGYNVGQEDLNAKVHSYVVFGNVGDRPNWPHFDPQAYGIEPLSVMAVVCDNKLFYGVWGDINGDDGDMAMVGEASISLATACFGTSMNGNFGHTEKDVLYIAFPGRDAVPGANGAAWTAQSFDEFHSSISALGDRLIQRIGNTGGDGGDGGDDGGDDDDCSWAGHCQGAPCTTWDDCADSLTCTNGICSPP
ncbi:family 75 glycoside hydrolase [Stachybotrys elegans]|uniref:Endo-chitosanase n=1 Tax=Stachybotrys elegans TaxID=80388 RepID=A0A8K0WVD0_9HYPO|nr:family 75 glycoside hydrolase [Stachybotrys elegans]